MRAARASGSWPNEGENVICVYNQRIDAFSASSTRPLSSFVVLIKLFISSVMWDMSYLAKATETITETRKSFISTADREMESLGRSVRGSTSPRSPKDEESEVIEPKWHSIYGVITQDTQKICRIGEHVEVLCGDFCLRIRAIDDDSKRYHYNVSWEQVMSSVEAGTGEGPEAEPMLYLVLVLDGRKVVEVTMRLLKSVRVLLGIHGMDTELSEATVLEAHPLVWATNMPVLHTDAHSADARSGRLHSR